MSLTNYLEQKFLEDYFIDQPVYAALMTTAPTDSDPGVEVDGPDYQRSVVTFVLDPANPSNDNIYNQDLIDFGNVPACSVLSVALYDAATGGNMLIYADLPSPATFSDNDAVVADPQTFSFTVN